MQLRAVRGNHMSYVSITLSLHAELLVINGWKGTYNSLPKMHFKLSMFLHLKTVPHHKRCDFMYNTADVALF